MAKPQLTLFLDVVSPFAYLAFYVTQHAPVFKQCDVNYIPIFLGGVMKACGNTPPLQIKNKAPWINLERQRWAREFNVPMSENTGDGFPPLTLGVMRAMCALTLVCPEKMTDTFAALYESLFVHGNPKMKEQEGWKPIFEEVVGAESTKEIIMMSTTAEVKALLAKNSDLALAEGAFGLPWWVATNREGKKECFWGFDHTKQVIRHLGLDTTEDASHAMDRGWRAML